MQGAGTTNLQSNAGRLGLSRVDDNRREKMLLFLKYCSLSSLVRSA